MKYAINNERTKRHLTMTSAYFEMKNWGMSGLTEYVTSKDVQVNKIDLSIHIKLSIVLLSQRILQSVQSKNYELEFLLNLVSNRNDNVNTCL